MDIPDWPFVINRGSKVVEEYGRMCYGNGGTAHARSYVLQ